MINSYRDAVRRVNCLTNDTDALYHLVARKLGITDSVLITAYMLHEKGDGCPLYDIYSESGVSKQTINTAIRKLEQDGILYLTRDKGRAKRVWLTDRGREFIANTAARLFEAECRTFDSWTQEEVEMYFKLIEKYNNAFRAQVEKM